MEPALALVPPPPARPPRVFYKMDSSRCGFAELGRHGNPLLAPLLWLSKIFRRRLDGSMHDPSVEELAAFQVDPGKVSAQTVARLREAAAVLARPGFLPEAAVFHLIVDLYNRSRIALAVVPSADGRSIARVLARTDGATERPVTLEFITCLDDGTLVQTTSARAYPEAPPGVRLVSRAGASAPALWKAHLEAIGGAAAFRSHDPLELAQRHHAAMRDFNLRRRVFVPRSPEEDADAVALEQAFLEARPHGVLVTQVMVEVVRLQRRRTGVSEAALLLVFSLLAFLASAKAGWIGSWHTALLLIPVLFFHELGHYLAMRAFGYRNLRMFFVPFLGAAVTGQNSGVAGWKRAVVALMGPLPGVLVGAVLAVAARIWHAPLLQETALLTLILNGINLLPLMPLDGGRIAHQLLFSRSPYVDAAFRALASLALLGYSIKQNDLALRMLGIATLVGLPLVFRMGKAAAALKAQLQPPPQELAGVAAATIINKVHALLPKARGPRALAQQSLNLFDAVTATPTGLGATLAIGGAHLATLLIAVISVGLIFFHRAPVVALPQPVKISRPISVAELASAGQVVDPPVPAPAPAPAEEKTLQAMVSKRAFERQLAPRAQIVANFSSTPQAAAAFQQVSQALSPDEVAVLFGQSVLLSLPEQAGPERARFFQLLEEKSTEVFVNAQGRLQLECTASDADAAKALEEDLQASLAPPQSLALIPAWLPPEEDPRSAAGRARHQLGRKTLLAVMRADSTQPGQALEEDERHSRAVAEALRHDDRAELQRLYQAGARTREARRAQAVEQLRAAPGLDPVTIDLYESRRLALLSRNPHGDPEEEELFSEAQPDSRDLDEPLAEQLGRLPMVLGRPVPGARRYSAMGAPQLTGSTLTFHWLAFDDLARGAPELVRFLDRRGCGSMKYELQGPVARSQAPRSRASE